MCKILEYNIFVNGINKGKSTQMVTGDDISIVAKIEIDSSDIATWNYNFNKYRTVTYLNNINSTGILSSDINITTIGTYIITANYGISDTTEPISIVHFEVQGYPAVVTCVKDTTQFIPEITSLMLSGYVNRYDTTKVEWKYTYQPGNGEALTSSHVPINSTEQYVIENFILPERGWTSVLYKGIIYPKSVSSLKWKCSGVPNYTCTQATDGIYNTQVECLSNCNVSSMKENSYIKYIFGLGFLVGSYIILKKK